MRFTIEDAVKTILRDKQDFNGDGGNDFYLGMEDVFDNAPLGVDINVYTNEDEEDYLSWTAVVYPLMEVMDAVEGTIIMPDFMNPLLTFNFLFTNQEKTKLDVCMSFSE